MGRGPLDLWSTMDRPALPAGGPPQSSSYGRSGAQGRRSRAGEGGAHRQLNEPLTRAQVVARRSSDGEGRWRLKARGGGTLRCEREGKEDCVGLGEVRRGQGTLL
jgi:hypothetical protein